MGGGFPGPPYPLGCCLLSFWLLLSPAWGAPSPLWCRPRTGTSARGGGPVHDAEEARRWILVWKAMRGIPPTQFTLSEYLSGREILCQSLWRDGVLILANTFERLSCFGADGVPSGVTSPSSLAKTISAPSVVELCRAAVRAIAPTYVRLGLGEPVELRGEYDAIEGYYLVRDLDALPGVFQADEFFEGILELGSRGGRS